MALSDELVSAFVKVTSDQTEIKQETTVYGTIVEHDGTKYVRLDGSDLLTPINSTADANAGERVTVLIKNHTATVTGNASSPAARKGSVEEIGDQITQVEILVADKVSTKQLDAANARIDNLVAEDVLIRGELTAQKATISELEAENVTISGKLTSAEASIESLEATKLDAEIADVKYATVESLNATNADIYNLEATHASFVEATTKRLNAADANIDDLFANKLDANTADITYAKIVDLDAVNAEIDKLDANVADIDTLIFGSASGNTIQTSFANAVIAMLGDAQIKSAMIESITAGKITAGDILTNKVRVMSEDGKLLISDETIQISDSSRVRVQIGKDAANDYSINIWDADGNLMFSEGGITDSAIKEAIIRNDMVSDDANISAHKLNIDSLFEEINGSSKTIKATKVYFDDKKQTLDVAFTGLTTEVSETKETVTSQGTAISVIQGQITSKIWQQDIDSAVGDIEDATDTLTSQYSALEQEIDGIAATVASHTTEIDSVTGDVIAVNNKVTQLEVDLTGFRSTVSSTYATKTALSETDAKAVSAQNGVDSLGTRMGTAEANITAAQKAADDAQSTANTAKTNAATAQAKADKAAQDAVAAQSAADDADAKASQAATDLATAQQNLANVTSRVDATEADIEEAQAAVVTAQAAADKAKADAATAQSTANTAKTNAATAQTAANNAKTAADNAKKAADDAQADVDALTIRMRAAETSIEQNSEQIALRATKTEVTDTLKGYYTIDETEAAIELSANEVKSTVSATYATKNALSETDTKAGNAATAASKAQSTANAAQTAATNAQTAANKAQDDADALDVRMTDAETSIGQNAEAIELRATKKEVSENHYTKTETDAKFKVTNDSISMTVKEEIDNLHIGSVNEIRNSDDLIFENYYFTGDFIVTHDGNGNVTVTCGASVTYDENGNVTMRSATTTTHDDAGNVTTR